MKKYKLLVDNLAMKKLILVNGDIATGKSHLALIIKEEYRLKHISVLSRYLFIHYLNFRESVNAL